MIKLIVGLANFQPKYFETRHNAGSWYVQRLVAHYYLSLKKENIFDGYVATINFQNNNIRLLIPTTYMNKSGISVIKIAQFYHIDPEEILVAHDELDLLPGDVQIKFSGSHNGHNGIKDIIQKFNNNNFYRLRIGIGRPKPSCNTEIVNFVLSKPLKLEQVKIDDILVKIVNYTDMIVFKKFSELMSIL